MAKNKKKLLMVGNGVPQMSEKEVKSKTRREILESNIYDALDKTANEVDGNVTVAELLDVMFKVSYSFNKKALLTEFE